MASSRRSAKSVELETRVAAALAAVPGRLLVAYSGGIDSTVLLHRVAAGRPREVFACHVHHGLQPAADDFVDHCTRVARVLGVPLAIERIGERPSRGDSVEAWARRARYRCLIAEARRIGAKAVLTAHHADDQLETFLMRLARGAGLAGLAAIQPEMEFEGMRMLRPLLGVERAAIERYALTHGLLWIDDPTNSDSRITRNALRTTATPPLKQALPSLITHLESTLDHLRSARDLIDEVALADLRDCVAGLHGSIALDRHRVVALSPARRGFVLRAWINASGLRPPAQARLAEIERQLVDGEGPNGFIEHDGALLWRYRDLIRIDRDGSVGLLAEPPEPASGEVVWRGEEAIEVPGFRGRLAVVIADGPGTVSSRWLHERRLRFDRPSSTSRLRPQPGAMSRTLKNLYQERGIPAWLRPHLPVVRAGVSVLYAAGLGMDASDRWPRATDGEAGVQLRWCPADAVAADLAQA